MDQVVFIYKKEQNFVEIQEADARRYTETIDNFIKDGGSRLDHSYDYNKDLKHCAIDDIVSDYPNDVCEWCIGEIDNLLNAKKTREFVPPTEDELRLIRITELKQNLANTDYVASKIAEGSATREEYADVIAQRQAWRAEINSLEQL